MIAQNEINKYLLGETCLKLFQDRLGLWRLRWFGWDGIILKCTTFSVLLWRECVSTEIWLLMMLTAIPVYNGLRMRSLSYHLLTN